uniref:Uncharacterized protein n=1 Tax=Rhizophora mucronata TaxID=61149 RepID=A0A2P2Q6L2_RHIMU
MVCPVLTVSLPQCKPSFTCQYRFYRTSILLMRQDCLSWEGMVNTQQI